MNKQSRQNGLQDPPALNPVGRPHTQRLTGALEGHPRGGGGAPRRDPYAAVSENAVVSGRRCGYCQIQGHTRPNCPSLQNLNSR
ncbi:uncharacterized protein BT62DRAFT_925421 [Guyanagaster necrorhizus]|uniref:CCHC-type domain-containing protein n=1 Tax=Guyanagaster necrorhizus TaxID=856835 RepID=A0A9P7W616_9AGAR|nr:uncharacterized protein BT62DRAFT_925421 [Guyanagaster necrorhizus MCA 3950]KAG7452879.1 hypothetical protein BT62DRAFT_925421 [Guyanagaster necrorhizus MCA 3950]